MNNLFHIGELVEILDTSIPQLFRSGIILSFTNNEYEILMLDCDDKQSVSLNKIRKIKK